MSSRYTLAVLKLILVMMWPLTVSAAALTPVDPFGISGIHVLVMSVISTLSGLTALTIRIDAELKKLDTDSLPRPRLFVVSHMLGSWLAGILAVALAQQGNIGVWGQIALVISASYIGAKFVEGISEKYLQNVSVTKE